MSHNIIKVNIGRIEEFVAKEMAVEGSVGLMIDSAHAILAARMIKPGIDMETLHRIVNGIEEVFGRHGKDIVLTITLEEAMRIIEPLFDSK